MSMPLTGLTIRDARTDDRASWYGLWDAYCGFYNATVPPEATATTWQRILDPESPIFGRLAERDGAILGFSVSVLHLGTWTPEPICYLEDLFVDPAARGGGIGRALVEDLLHLAAARGWSRLYWHTESGNARARRIYDRFAPADGFVRYRLFVPANRMTRTGDST